MWGRLEAHTLPGVFSLLNHARPNAAAAMALLGNTDPSVHEKYGAKDKAIRFQHGLAEAVASVSYAGLDRRTS